MGFIDIATGVEAIRALGAVRWELLQACHPVGVGFVMDIYAYICVISHFQCVRHFKTVASGHCKTGEKEVDVAWFLAWPGGYS